MKPSPRSIDLLVVGELNPDVIVHQPGLQPRFGQVEQVVDEVRLEIGSSSAIVACGAARLGLRVAFVGAVGDDPFGRFVLDELTERGIDVAHCRVESDVPTGATVILSRGDDRAILTAVGAMDRLTAADVPLGLIAASRHLHVGGVFLQPRLKAGIADLFRSARSAGVSTSLDTNWDPSEAWAGLAPVLAQTDLFLPNTAEATALTGDHDPESAARSLATQLARDGIVAVKRGADGAVAVRGRRYASSPTLSIDSVDSTGAGDTFDAGMISALLDGVPLEDALRFAVACGSLSVRAVGGTTAQPTKDEALAAAATLAHVAGRGAAARISRIASTGRSGS